MPVGEQIGAMALQQETDLREIGAFHILEIAAVEFEIVEDGEIFTQIRVRSSIVQRNIHVCGDLFFGRDPGTIYPLSGAKKSGPSGKPDRP